VRERRSLHAAQKTPTHGRSGAEPTVRGLSAEFMSRTPHVKATGWRVKGAYNELQERVLCSIRRRQRRHRCTTLPVALVDAVVPRRWVHTVAISDEGAQRTALSQR
jgi:hypothetical protein